MTEIKQLRFSWSPRRSRLPLGVPTKRIAILLTVLLVSPLCHAETWVEVRHGAFATPDESLTQVRATLKQTIGAAIQANGASAPDWSGYLVQYRGATIRGRRVIEIHGSCGFHSTSFDSRSEFYDEGVSDGGACYFLVYFDIKTQHYSNVVFHGYA
jgi:hypothetical protein